MISAQSTTSSQSLAPVGGRRPRRTDSIGAYEVRGPVEGAGHPDLRLAYPADRGTVDGPVVLLVLDEADARSRGGLRRAAAAMRMRHATLVKVLDLALDRGRVAIVTEYADATSLARFRDLGALSLKTFSRPSALLLAAHLLDALQDVHDLEDEGEGWVHGYVVPDSVLIAPDGTVRLAGFGLPLPVDHDPFPLPWNGDVDEDKESLEPRDDQYAVGLILLQLLNGLDLSTVSDPEVRCELVKRSLEGMPLGDVLLPTLLRLLAPRAHGRFNTATEAATELRRLAGRDAASALAADATRLFDSVEPADLSSDVLLDPSSMVMRAQKEAARSAGVARPRPMTPFGEGFDVSFRDMHDPPGSDEIPVNAALQFEDGLAASIDLLDEWSDLSEQRRPAPGERVDAPVKPVRRPRKTAQLRAATAKRRGGLESDEAPGPKLIEKRSQRPRPLSSPGAIGEWLPDGLGGQNLELARTVPTAPGFVSGPKLPAAPGSSGSYATREGRTIPYSPAFVPKASTWRRIEELGRGPLVGFAGDEPSLNERSDGAVASDPVDGETIPLDRPLGLEPAAPLLGSESRYSDRELRIPSNPEVMARVWRQTTDEMDIVPSRPRMSPGTPVTLPGAPDNPKVRRKHRRRRKRRVSRLQRMLGAAPPPRRRRRAADEKTHRLEDLRDAPSTPRSAPPAAPRQRPGKPVRVGGGWVASGLYAARRLAAQDPPARRDHFRADAAESLPRFDVREHVIENSPVVKGLVLMLVCGLLLLGAKLVTELVVSKETARAGLEQDATSEPPLLE